MELQAHNTPRLEAFKNLALVLSGALATPPTHIAIISNTGSTMGTATFQTTSPSSPGYIFSWGTISTTGLSGITGTAYGVFYVTNIQSTVTGTIATIAILNASGPMFIGAPASPVTVVTNQLVQVSVAIFTGFSYGFGSISVIGVSVTAVVNPAYLQAIPFIYLPSPILLLTTASYARFISSVLLSTLAFPVGRPDCSYSSINTSALWPATAILTSNVSVATVVWVGVASPSVVWAGSTTTYTFYVTVQAILSSPVTFPAGVSHFFTLNALWAAP
jgi:hypothetical protein